MRHAIRLAPLALASMALSMVTACGGAGGTSGADAPQERRRPMHAAAPAARAATARTPFENPGGMWMPHQIAGHAETLRSLGLRIHPADLADPMSGVLSAVVSLGGCSASFISREGLLATNHHCATGALQHNSTPAENLLKDGWLAKTRADEKNNGPQARVFVTRAVTEVTDEVIRDLEAIRDPRARFKAIEERQKKIVAACEADESGQRRSGVRCTVSSFYEGAQYFLTTQMEIRDVRLVWAPPAGVGNYGGEIDNWRWPRHTGDVSFFRAYVGRDGQPADYSPDNVPYEPPHWLKIATEPLGEGDLVFVAGYPGRTSTLKTRSEVAEAVSWGYPRRQKMLEDYLARLEAATDGDKEAQIRATSYVRRFANYLTNTKGQIEGLAKGGLAAQKEKADADLRAFVAGHPSSKARWEAALDAIDAEVARNATFRESDAQLEEIHLPKLVSAAQTIVRMAEERVKPDEERDPDYQARNWPRHEQALAALSTGYHPKVDQAVLALALERAAAVPEDQRTPALAVLVGKNPTPASIKSAVASLYARTTLADERTRAELLKKGRLADLKKSRDPLLRAALSLRPLTRAAEERRERLAGTMAVLKPKYIEALRAFRGAPFAPDANSTLRITYGTVRGYRPTADAPLYRPFTVLSEVVKKHQGKEPFDVPARLLAAHEAGKTGPYVDTRLGDVPVDFLADLHITGGNSGSATLNARGELVGLVFDGNYESMASDWVFVPSITRSIHVDVRYVLWLLDAVDGGDHLLREMSVTPKID
jgi:hypothetical protein